VRVAGDRLERRISTTRAASGSPTVYAALEVGITRFDACLAGIGGCPHAPGASGNVDTEDLVFMLESMGIATGVDFEIAGRCAASVAKWLEGETLHGTVWRAGLPKTMPALRPKKWPHER
jgi:hydroxymethylglutaryl-CoA lyase